MSAKPIGTMPAIMLVPTALSAIGSQLYKSLEMRDNTANARMPITNPHVGKFRVEVTRVSVGAVAYACAETVTGQNGDLRSTPHGPATVLWMESSGAVRWAVIRFDDSNYEEIVFVTSNFPDGNGYYPGVVQRFNVATKSWSTIFNCKVVDANR